MKSHDVIHGLTLLTVVVVGASIVCSAQDNHCGNPSGGNACPAGCSQNPFQHGIFNDQGIAYLGTATLYCGTTCGYVQTNIVITYPCMPGGSAVTPELYNKLRDIAGEREILVAGCGNNFKTLEEPPVSRASAKTQVPGD